MNSAFALIGCFSNSVLFVGSEQDCRKMASEGLEPQMLLVRIVEPITPHDEAPLPDNVIRGPWTAQQEPHDPAI